MVDNNTEMSLDEVLSSIKKMVVDDEPPVLDLTDMVATDETVVNVRDNCSRNKDNENSDISSFLRLIQESADDSSNETPEKIEKKDCVAKKSKISPTIRIDSSPTHSICQGRETLDKDEALVGLIKELIYPLVNKWMNENLPTIAGRIIETEIRKLLNNKSN